MNMILDEDTIVILTFVAFWILIILVTHIKKVPSGTVYIIDRNTHYLKTVKRGFFFFNQKTDKITTEISLTPKTKIYRNFFETHDGVICTVTFSFSFSALDVEDVLYNLNSTRRSIDDVLQTCMYNAVLALKQSDVNVSSLEQEFERNMNSQVLGLCINVHQYQITSLNKGRYTRSSVTPFTPHKSRSLSGSYVDYNIKQY